MMTESPINRMQELWRCQPVEGIKMSVEEIRNRATKFENKIFWRNVREYIAGVITIVVLGISFAGANDLLSCAASGLLIAGMVYVMYQLHRRGAAKTTPTAVAAGPSLAFYRGELKRQRDLSASVWSWYLGPFVPGLVFSAIASAAHDLHLHHIAVVTFWYVLIAAFFVFVWRLNARATRCLERTIADLGSAE
ncbi:MAG: hypothetical protein JOZ14_15580 [Acidobacteria bacterium]|nr:hypothetical protein [Acidobacteriota bacterium]